jgi:hypothetical protein
MLFFRTENRTKRVIQQTLFFWSERRILPWAEQATSRHKKRLSLIATKKHSSKDTDLTLLSNHQRFLFSLSWTLQPQKFYLLLWVTKCMLNLLSELGLWHLRNDSSLLYLSHWNPLVMKTKIPLTQYYLFITHPFLWVKVEIVILLIVFSLVLRIFCFFHFHQLIRIGFEMKRRSRLVSFMHSVQVELIFRHVDFNTLRVKYTQWKI